MNAEQLTDVVGKKIKQIFDDKKKALGSHFNEVIQFILLQTMDSRWKEHLENIDYVKESINLRGYAQKDPLIEYKKEAFSLFEKMNQQVGEESLEKLFKIQISATPSEHDFSSQYEQEEFDYSKQEMNWSQMKSKKEEQENFSYNKGQESAPQLNRAQRRMQSKKKKKKIKI